MEEIPTNDINLYKDDVIVKLNKNMLNKDYTISKRINKFNINDNIKVTLLNTKHISYNEQLDEIIKIPNIHKGVMCKIIDIDLWEPSSIIERKKKILKIIPGSFILQHKNKKNNMNFRDIDALFTCTVT